MISGYSKLVLVFLMLFIPSELCAQIIVFDAIEISLPNQTGESTLPTYSNFNGNTKNPLLFRTKNISELSRSNETSKNAFSIDFIFHLKSSSKHQFIAGFEASSFTTDLYELSGTFQDSLSTSTSLRSKSEFFFLKSGYNYVHTPDNRFTFMAGGILNFGIPVSAKTSELITTTESLSIEQEYSFFARQSASFGLSIPMGIRFKVIKNISLSFTTNPGFQFQKIDGNPVIITFQGASLSLYFKFRER